MDDINVNVNNGLYNSPVYPVTDGRKKTGSVLSSSFCFKPTLRLCSCDSTFTYEYKRTILCRINVLFFLVPSPPTNLHFYTGVTLKLTS